MFWLVPTAIVGGVALYLTVRRPIRVWGGQVLQARARESFLLQREKLEAQFMSSAAATGKPRGLRWMDCDFGSELELARELATGQIVGLVPVTIRFEAVEGSDMEGLAAVGNLRNASAVFVFEKGQWQTAGKAVFNLNPLEVIEHFHQQYERMAPV